MAEDTVVVNKNQEHFLGDLVAKYNGRRESEKQANLPQKAYDFVVQKIMDGTFSPAKKLVERELASQLKISSVPVREAMEKLDVATLVVDRPGADLNIEAQLRFSNSDSAADIGNTLIGFLVLAKGFAPDEQTQELLKKLEIAL